MRNYLKMFAVIGVLIVSCKKDKTPFPFEPPYNDLEHGWQDDFGDEDFIYPGWSFLIEDSLQFHVPQFNPSNPEEIIYYRHDYTTNSHQLIKYNLRTTEKNTLTNGLMIRHEPSYSSQGQIVFSTFPDGQLFIVNDSGTETSLFTSDSPFGYPTWMSNGDCILFTEIHTNQRNLIKKCISSNSPDTLINANQPVYFVSMMRKISNMDLLLIRATLNNSGYYAYANLLEDSLVLHPIYNYINGIAHDTDYFCWSHDSQYIYLAYHTTGKIYKVRVSDGEVELFRDQFNGNWLHSIAASPDGKYLIVERVVLSNTFTSTGELNFGIRTHSQIQLIDIETQKIKILDLD